MNSLSIIIPTNGANNLSVLLNGLLVQMKSEDEIILIGDGPQPDARSLLQDSDSRIRYFEFGPSRCWGFPQRNAALGLCKGRYVLTLEDTDQVLPDALEAIRSASDEAPDRPFMFRVRRPEGPVWVSKAITKDNVLSQMFVAPNIEGRLGRWGRRREGGMDFIASTLNQYPEGTDALVWRREALAILSENS